MTKRDEPTDNEIDEEIVDRERAAAIDKMPIGKLIKALDRARRFEAAEIERATERAMEDLERETYSEGIDDDETGDD